MKKKVLIIICIMIDIFVLTNISNKCYNVVSNMDGISSKGRVNEQMELSEDFSMKNYFHNLNDNLASNDNGTCWLVAFISCLSYYDTFFNDDLIPEQYDRSTYSNSKKYSSSPGVLHKNQPVENPQLLKKFVEDYKSIDYESYILDLIYEGNYPTELGEKYDILPKILSYLNITTLCFNYEYDSCFFRGEDGLIDYIKNNLDMNRPVILGICDRLESAPKIGHIVVAYYYDENGIHCNFGWQGYYDCLIQPNDQIYAAGIFDTENLKHKHSNNYYISGTHYCGCGHRHNYYDHYCDCGKYYANAHLFNYSYNNTKTHRVYCHCGYYRNEGHFVEGPINPKQKYGICIYCGGKAEMGLVGPGNIVDTDKLNYNKKLFNLFN